MNDKSFRVLLIDDDEDEYVNIKALLKEVEFSKIELIWCSTYQQGLTHLQSGPIDACLLDYRLGENSGLDLLRDAHAAYVSCPVILLTGQGDLEVDIKAMQAGAADYLVKGQLSGPLLERAIRYAIKRALDLRELSEQKETFQTLFNSTFEGILVLRSNRIVDANRSASQILGCPLEDIIGLTLDKLFSTDTTTKIIEELKMGREFRHEVTIQGPNNSDLPVEIAGRQVIMNQQSALLIAFNDLTQRKNMEAQILQQDRLASLGLLASSLAHEIGTPLGVIRGRAELVMRSADEKTKNTMELITGQIDRIAKLVHSLLHLARSPKSGGSVAVPIKPVFDDVLNLIRHELDLKGISLHAEIPETLIARAEPAPLGQVLLNLFVNAIYAIDKKGHGSKLISVKIAESDLDVQISIQDSGIGVAPEHRRRLFQPFFTTKEIGQGTGLGLATSLNLVRGWGGDIRFESQSGEGSTFTIVLRS